jgi:hypothetical protein
VLVAGACCLAGCSGADDEPVEREVAYGPSADRIELREFYHAFDERFDLAVVEGVAANEGDEARQVSIAVDYFDGGGGLVATSSTVAVPGAEPLDPGESVPFDTGFNGAVGEVVRYVVSVTASGA